MPDERYYGKQLARRLVALLNDASLIHGYTGYISTYDTIRYALAHCPMSFNQFGTLVSLRDDYLEIPAEGFDLGDAKRGSEENAPSSLFRQAFGETLEPSPPVIRAALEEVDWLEAKGF